MPYNWKVGDKFWVDYARIREDGYSEWMWKEWFPEDKQPFTVSKVRVKSVKGEKYFIEFRWIYINKQAVIKAILDRV